MRFQFLALILLLLLSAACANKAVDPSELSGDSAEDAASTRWVYAEKGLVLNFLARPDLNMFDSAPHTLLLCVYELSSREGFEQLSQSRPGLDKLLSCQNFDPSVILSTRRVIHPGMKGSVILDRHENARFVAVVGGFYNMVPGRATMVKAIPVVEQQDGYFWWSKRKYSPAVLNMTIELGADGFNPAKVAGK